MSNGLKHWLQIDHITFLIAFLLVSFNIVFHDKEITKVAWIFLWIALIYDLKERLEDE